jgi:hypothetical protein
LDSGTLLLCGSDHTGIPEDEKVQPAFCRFGFSEKLDDLSFHFIVWFNTCVNAEAGSANIYNH